MALYGLYFGGLISVEIRDRGFNERAGLPFPCLIQEMCEDAGIPLSRFYYCHTIVTKCTNLELIKDMDNPLYKEKSTRNVLPLPITMGPPPTTLSLERLPSSLSTDKATEMTKGKSGLTSSTPTTTCIMVTVPYAFIEKLV